MVASSCKYEALSKRNSFNASVRHVKSTISLAECIADGENVADAINELIEDGSVNSDEILPFVSMLLSDKCGYAAVAKNITSTVKDFSLVQKLVSKWNAFDFVVVYTHPDVGVIAINPKNALHVGRIDRMSKSELVVVYIGCFGREFDKLQAEKAGNAIIDMYESGKAKDIPAFSKGKCAYKQPKAPQAAEEEKPKKVKAAKSAKGKAKKETATVSVEYRPTVLPSASASPATNAQAYSGSSANVAGAQMAAPRKGVRMTPMYGVTVTNELFHNGNVEAWKRIIDSYKTKHPDLDVLVYYDGERITNLNALFKWGKVKHGSQIQFAVQGSEISDVAKLQRYLAQGASSMFEAFLRGPVNGVLSLF